MHAHFNLTEIWHTYWELKANTCIKFGVNVINNKAVINNIMHKTKSNFCHTCRVNHFEEQAKNQYVARLNIREVPFGG